MDGYTEVGFLDINTGYAGGFAVDQLTDGVYKLGRGYSFCEKISARVPNSSPTRIPARGLVNLGSKPVSRMCWFA